MSTIGNHLESGHLLPLPQLSDAEWAARDARLAAAESERVADDERKRIDELRRGLGRKMPAPPSSNHIFLSGCHTSISTLGSV